MYHSSMVEKWEKVLIWAAVTLLILAFVYIVSYPYYLRDRPMFYEFGGPDVEERVIGGDDHWDVTFEVIDYEEMDPTVWSEMEIVVTSESGNELLRTRTVKENDPSQYDNGTNGTVDVEVWYVNGDTRLTGGMDTGDLLVFTGLTKEFQGATIRIFHTTQQFGDRIAEERFPPRFE